MAMKLKLKVLWLPNLLGFALDWEGMQSSFPATQYYFWPRTEAWDQLKLELDSKFLVTEEEKIKILNFITEIMNFWLENKQATQQKNYSSGVEFVEIQDY